MTKATSIKEELFYIVSMKQNFKHTGRFSDGCLAS